MNFVFWMILVLTVVMIILAIAILVKYRHEDSMPIEHKPQRNIEQFPPPNNACDEPILSTHARQRMEERLGVYSSQQEEMMINAYKFGRTADRTNGDLRMKLEDTESKCDDPTIAKFYNGAIFIFSEEDNVLKTVYKYNPNHYLN